ncbi:hypothetical protein GWK47_025057 [Chionoecetes opilio]|uniref:Uncharacterized protein n=1 Tax=Chionoecetes opilio TaxID=41210 RepID=A0A8J5CC53_CHIOP|nr:hypothetical protein GWK47_025057 [Chionoecetes opilio]
MLEVKETREDIDNTTVVLLVEAAQRLHGLREEGDEDMALLNIQLDEEQERVSLSDAVLVASRQFTEMLNRGKLNQNPQTSPLTSSGRSASCGGLSCALKETRLLLLQANSSCEVFVRVVPPKFFVDDGQLHDTKYEAGHDFFWGCRALPRQALFKERNMKIHSSKHGPPLTPS